ncbi:-Lysophospholipid acyltransferase LPCAT4 [Babesia bigemina]|uniref:-Lysophospholipid acyltransferase LPCAT4 n=1 Tax=Babesia bigemina TaxID=5866 RepID=A0A061DCV9_BABBI|nr:-Lysophospholipid acyltransferase LPCAT4 [Babesia bigemina]CDR98032.1 -Lysophospholipid acyltransferase LPCAT4 [Babesia bigemina]|eukprot:XP_012770218.1 -Lysophospholipid acyltransferase LPCAT4 [Babesia bigemina]
MRSINEGREKVSLVVYPEGTTCKGSVLLPFKHGAFGALVPLHPLLVVLEYSYLDIAYDVFSWQWWTIHACCSPASVRLIAYWLPAIQPPTEEEVARKGAHECVREYAIYANRVMREAIAKLNPHADLEHLQKRDVIVSPTLRGKLTARLYGPVMQRHYELTDAEVHKTEEVVFH